MLEKLFSEKKFFMGFLKIFFDLRHAYYAYEDMQTFTMKMATFGKKKRKFFIKKPNWEYNFVLFVLCEQRLSKMSKWEF